MGGLDPVLMFGQVNAQTQRAFFQFNAALVAYGLPMYYFGGASFNTDYRMAPPPRFVLQWMPPFVRLEQIYLSYKPGDSEQVDIVYTVSTNGLTVSRHGAV